MNASSTPPIPADYPDVCTELLKVIGDFWTLAIIRKLREGELRFSEIERSLVGSNPVTISSRLKKLEETGFVNRVERSCDKLSVTYSLTEKGERMLPILQGIEDFAAEFQV